MAVAYSERLRESLAGVDDVVIEVCGGSGVTLEILENWKSTFGL